MSSRPLKASPQRAEQLRTLLDSVNIGPRQPGDFREANTKQLVKNESGEVIPPYSCLMPIGVIMQNGRPVIEVDKYDGSYSGEFIFSWHFEIDVDAVGVAQVGRVVRAAYQGGTGEGNYEATNDEWYLSDGGNDVQGFGAAGTGELIGALIASGGSADIPECSGGGVEIPGLADSPIVDAMDADYIVGIRDGCTVLIERAECDDDEPSVSVSPPSSVSSVSDSSFSFSGPIISEPPPPEDEMLFDFDDDFMMPLSELLPIDDEEISISDEPAEDP